MNQDSGTISRRALLGGVLGAAPLAVMGSNSSPSVAITMDDMYWSRLADPMAANQKMLEVARKHRVQFALFVIGENAESETGRAIVRSWKEAGHLIGNHTWSHRRYNAISFDEFSADVLRAEVTLGEVTPGASPGTPRMFRFPTLAEGDTVEKREKMREFLKMRGYRNGHVTVDASDWFYDARLRERLEREPGFDVARFRQPYLDHLWDRAQFYDSLSRRVLGHTIPHTLLVHYNLLNSLFLGDVVDMFAQRGWRIIGAEEAYRDPVFRRSPLSMPSGQSLIWALAKETGRFGGQLRYPGEDDVYEKPLLDRLRL